MDNKADKVRVRLQISGRVQGVYFRASAVQRAQELGVTGWVMNCSDGSVAIVAEGTRQQLEDLTSWCRHGPDGARVTDVAVEWNPARNDFRAFTIKR